MADISFQKDFSRHPLHYFYLLCVQLIGLWGVFWFSYDPFMQLAIVISMAASYVIWGIVHHQHHNDLHIKIVVEYILYAVLAVLIFASLVFRV